MAADVCNITYSGTPRTEYRGLATAMQRTAQTAWSNT